MDFTADCNIHNMYNVSGKDYLLPENTSIILNNK